MKTVYDLIRHRTTPQIICRNCDNSSILNHRFLAGQCGIHTSLADLKFVCRRCQSRNYRIKPVADTLGEPEPLRMHHFRGVYENKRD